MANEKNKAAEEKRGNQAGSELSVILDMFGPDAKRWFKRVALIVLGILVAFLAVRQLRASRAAKVAEGYAKLGEATTVEALSRVCADYSGTPIAVQAQLSAAQMLFEEGKYKEAAERFGLPANSGQEAMLRGLLGRAHALEAAATADASKAVDMAVLEDALGAFEQAGKTSATLDLASPLVDALLGQARCQRLKGDNPKARELLGDAMKTTQKDDSPVLANLAKRVEDAVRAMDAYELATVAPAKVGEPTADDKPIADDKPAAKDGK